jgi:hypothetical protein
MVEETETRLNVCLGINLLDEVQEKRARTARCNARLRLAKNK